MARIRVLSCRTRNPHHHRPDRPSSTRRSTEKCTRLTHNPDSHTKHRCRRNLHEKASTWEKRKTGTVNHTAHPRPRPRLGRVRVSLETRLPHTRVTIAPVHDKHLLNRCCPPFWAASTVPEVPVSTSVRAGVKAFFCLRTVLNHEDFPSIRQSLVTCNKLGVDNGKIYLTCINARAPVHMTNTGLNVLQCADGHSSRPLW